MRAYEPPKAPEPAPPTLEQEALAALEARRHDPDKAAVDRNRAFIGQMLPGTGSPDEWAETKSRWEAEDNAERDRLVTEYLNRQGLNF